MKFSKEMGPNNSLVILLFSNMATPILSIVFHGGELASECSGTLTVRGNSEVHKFTASVESLGAGIVAGRVRMEGCGCYILYQGPRRMGRAYFITQSGDHALTFSRIGSVYKDTCGKKGHRNAGLAVLVVGIVVGLVVVVLGGSLCLWKRKKMYTEVIPESVL